MSSQTSIKQEAWRKVIATILIGLAIPVLLAIVFTPSTTAKAVSGGIAALFILISVFLLRSGAK